MELADLSDADLQIGLSDDDAKIAFWVDVYNAAAQLRPLDDVGSVRGRFRLFRRPAVTVAGRALSLDAIEHGILRRSRWKLGLGYLGNPLPSPFERSHRVRRVDPRIHFALNCGAASCPPIMAYDAARIEEQLDVSSRSYLVSEVIKDGHTLRLPTVMLWFVGDFGGPRGMRRFLGRHGIVTDGRRLRFRAYDWDPAPGRWTDRS
jgi:hypothetical protein